MNHLNIWWIENYKNDNALPNILPIIKILPNIIWYAYSNLIQYLNYTELKNIGIIYVLWFIAYYNMVNLIGSFNIII